MKLSKISWCDYSGEDLNIVCGCTKVSEGCRFCFAEAIYKRFGKDFSQVTVHPEKLERLLHKRFPEFSPRRGAPHKPMCFLVDTGDLFHEDVPRHFILNVLARLEWERDDVIWQILTKRPARAREIIRARSEELRPLPPHIWFGVSVENQRTADERIPILLDTPAAVRFVSIEPMLEPIDLFSVDGEIAVRMANTMCYPADLIDWVIVGAESGPNRRPFDVAWAADIMRQCNEAGVAYFGKQDSGLYPGVPLLIDGRTWHEWPGGMR